ncbi:MAG: rRNA adenine dimethylase, partial [Lentisphaerae bacterium]|nr:rRNA adenine dimethylase [Lentisphaerota bacterium]
FSAASMAAELKRHKSVIIRNRGIVTWGTVSPEQAFVFFSSACFACFVKFFSDYLYAAKQGTLTAKQTRLFESVADQLYPLPETPPTLMRGPFTNETDVYNAVIEAGRKTVEYRLVDSFFGNVSYLHDNTLYISQTGSSLDELEGCVDPCVLDGSSCAGITASSELTAHREIVLGTGRQAILHGHPKFSVTLSMYCDKYGCDRRDRCHTRCADYRAIDDVPIVPGEVGTGPHGLCHTLPPAMEGNRGVIVYGHGLFTTGQDDFNEAFSSLLSIERLCRQRYFELVGG